jgi:hypothetical protein
MEWIKGMLQHAQQQVSELWKNVHNPRELGENGECWTKRPNGEQSVEQSNLLVCILDLNLSAF